MHIVILGAGALGVYFGGRWIESGVDVTFLVREKRAAQIKEKGLKINSSHGDYEIQNPHVITDPSEIESADLVLFSVKGFHLAGAMEQLRALAAKGASILPVLNGIEHIKILQEQLGKEFVIGGLSYIFAELNDQGHVEQAGDMHELYFGPLEPSQEKICSGLADISQSAEFNGKKSPDITRELWKKYMFITALSGVTTAANLPIGPVREHPETFHIAEMILREMQTLAKEYGADITDADVDSAIKNVHALDPEATSSMHKDRRKGLRLEVDHLQGGAVRLAEDVNVDVPYIRAVLGMIKPFERP
ncbi:ketopantoate reductase family protein [Lentibacillus salicampi]|uniref:2-dehydropantoate 2-reductase n=1 Tax=Lentibacillus salicampi TaxID=175306 RepID=A0A4Y9A6S1_9BACI|nr:ketopantoate reductase family protein [Lentibacillus salicampi]TFJ91388.1 ketopantoate reductase family protein [Lentibacillus salicampi]